MRLHLTISRNGYALVHDPELADYYYQKAFKWCDENSVLLDPEIWFDLSEMYKADIPDPVDEQITCGQWEAVTSERAIYWLRKAANHGFASAQCVLGDAYRDGTGVETNFKQAAYWYEKSAQQGYADAQIALGWCYESGKGVPKNGAIAVEWIHKAAEQGSAWGQVSLGFIYQEGICVKKDIEQAIHWYCKAAEQGDRNAVSSLKDFGIDWNTK